MDREPGVRRYEMGHAMTDRHEVRHATPATDPASAPDPDRDPIGPFLHYLMAECGVSPNTLAAYRSDIVRFVRWRKAARARARWRDLRSPPWPVTSTAWRGCGWRPAASAGTWRACPRSSGS